MPGFCTRAFWYQLFEIIHDFGGDVVTVMRQKTHREQALIQEQDRKPDNTWDWLQLKPDEIRPVLGCFIGEPTTLTHRRLASRCPTEPDNRRPYRPGWPHPIPAHPHGRPATAATFAVRSRGGVPVPRRAVWTTAAAGPTVASSV